MKRQLNIVMIAVFLFMAIASPVSASEIDTDTWFPVLDYTTVDDSGYVFITVNKSETVSFDLFGIRACYSFDILCNITGDRTNLGAQVTVNGRTFDLKVLHVGDYLYRLYGNVAGGLADTEVELTITSAGVSYVTFYQFDVLSVKHSSFPETGQMATSDVGGNHAFQQMADSSTVLTIKLEADKTLYTSSTPRQFTANIYPDNWRKYEYIDIIFSLQALSIDSIVCRSGTIGLPFEISVYDSASALWYGDGYFDYSHSDPDASWNDSYGDLHFALNDNAYSVVLRLYVKDLDPDTASAPYVSINGQYDVWSEYESIALRAVTGHVQTDDINPLHYYFQDLYRKLGNWFRKVIDALEGDTAPGNEFQDEIQNEIDEIDRNQQIIDSLQKPVKQNLDINDWQTTVNTTIIAAAVGPIASSPSFILLIGMAVSACLVAYLIFGKR